MNLSTGLQRCTRAQSLSVPVPPSNPTLWLADRCLSGVPPLVDSRQEESPCWHRKSELERAALPAVPQAPGAPFHFASWSHLRVAQGSLATASRKARKKTLTDEMVTYLLEKLSPAVKDIREALRDGFDELTEAIAEIDAQTEEIGRAHV